MNAFILYVEFRYLLEYYDFEVAMTDYHWCNSHLNSSVYNPWEWNRIKTQTHDGFIPSSPVVSDSSGTLEYDVWLRSTLAIVVF